MTRPKPSIIMEAVTDAGCEAILAATGVYAVFWQGQPINHRVTVPDGRMRYRKTSFPNSGHALKLARWLNERFATDGFAAYCLTTGEPL